MPCGGQPLDVSGPRFLHLKSKVLSGLMRLCKTAALRDWGAGSSFQSGEMKLQQVSRNNNSSVGTTGRNTHETKGLNLDVKPFCMQPTTSRHVLTPARHLTLKQYI